eukprot:Nitzschia sp. Nitz4//scaffold8_size234185//60503//62257//NITZ4_001244-RA/size234185-augustus-gene-0.240-mRNA-1//1//CDS//3329559767//2813//frame0
MDSYSHHHHHSHHDIMATSHYYSYLLPAGFLLFLVCLTDLLSCPHSKVEESFQLQATHDLFYHGVSPAFRATFLGSETPLPYDHLQFPGVVPRTFLGPFVLASLCQIVRVLFLPFVDIATRPMFVQFLARFFLMTANVFGWFQLALAIERAPDLKGRFVGVWMLVITACQFHIPFYASRMLPNTFALAIVLQAYSFWVQDKIQLAAAFVVAATAVFRCDVLLLLACVGLMWLVTGKLSIFQALKVGVMTGVVSLLATVPIDSLLWQRILWPEGEVFFFNTVLGKSSEWGTSAWHWYFTSALPKSMLLTLLLVPLSVVRVPEFLVSLELSFRGKAVRGGMSVVQLVDKTWLYYVIPIFGFIVLYSNLGHKEMRFIFPALPILNAAAGAGMARLSMVAFPSKGKVASIVGRLGFAVGILCLLLTFVGNASFVAVSRLNYPGGEALQRLNNIFRDQSNPPVKADDAPLQVYIDVASAMSGVSLFGQHTLEQAYSPGRLQFQKSGYEEDNALHVGLGEFDYMLTESIEPHSQCQVMYTIPGEPRLNVRALRIDTKPAIHVLECKKE